MLQQGKTREGMTEGGVFVGSREGTDKERSEGERDEERNGRRGREGKCPRHRAPLLVFQGWGFRVDNTGAVHFTSRAVSPGLSGLGSIPRDTFSTLVTSWKLAWRDEARAMRQAVSGTMVCSPDGFRERENARWMGRECSVPALC